MKTNIWKQLSNCSWLKSLHSDALGWKYRIQLLLVKAMASSYSWLKANLRKIVFNYSWLKLLYANNVSNWSWLKYHSQLFLDDIIAFNYSWLKLLCPSTLGWKSNLLGNIKDSLGNKHIRELLEIYWESISKAFRFGELLPDKIAEEISNLSYTCHEMFILDKYFEETCWGKCWWGYLSKESCWYETRLVSSWNLAREKSWGNFVGRYLLRKPNRNFVDTRVQMGNINHLAGEENLPLRIITINNGLLKVTCTEENNCSTLENTSWILIMLRITLNLLERLMNMG